MQNVKLRRLADFLHQIKLIFKRRKERIAPFHLTLHQREIQIRTARQRLLINLRAAADENVIRKFLRVELVQHLKRAYQFHFAKLGEKIETEIFIFKTLDKLDPAEFPNDIFICGGAQIYEQALPRCSDLYLTLVKREVEGGDAFFPAFEDKFDLVEKVRETPEFDILHYRRRSLRLE